MPRKESKYPVLTIAKYILSRTSITPKKLQKLLYYTYQWYLYVFNDDEDHIEIRLFDEPFEAWVHGPVIPSLYRRYSCFGYARIYESDQMDAEKEIDLEDKQVIDNALSVYAKYDADTLERLSHLESSWKNQRKGYKPWENCNNIMLDKDIYHDCALRNDD